MIRRIPALAALAALAAILATPSVPAAELTYVVEGVTGAPADNVRAYLGGPETVGSAREARGLARSAREKTADALRAVGYYEPEIDTRLGGDADSGWRMTVTVAPGQPVRLRDVEITVRGAATEDRDFQRLTGQLQLSEGDILNHGAYDSAKNALRSRALTRGYFDYAFSASRIEINTAEHWADIRLVLDSGPRYRIGEVTWSQTPFRDDLIERLIPFDPPLPYTADDIAALNRRLLDSGYFRTVRVDVKREAVADGMVPVHLELAAREPNTLGFGLGFSTDEGPRARASWERHYVNTRGHQLFSELRVSPVRQNATTRYVIPLRDPLNDRLQFQAGVQAEDIEDSRSRRLTVGVQREQTFTSGWRRVQSLRYLQERFEQGDDNFNTGLLLPGITFSRTRARGQPDPYWGDTQSYAIEAGHESLLSDISLARVTVSNKWLRSVDRRHRFLLRLDAGGLATSDFEEVPASLRFFAGGDNSVRGFGYRTLSPENDDGELTGGRYLLTGSAEYSYPIRPQWRLAVFADAGNAFNDFPAPEYKVGTGFGVRWISPVGPIRLDFAWGVSEDDVPFRLHLSLGPPF